MDKRVLTIQDISCIGQCSLTVALPVISACGIECGILPSSVLSNHTAKGFGGWTFKDLTDEMPAILEQWKKENVKFDAFYTGYVSKAQIPHILNIIENTKASDSFVIIDPVMADNGKLYSGFSEDFPEEMKKLCKKADLIMPNLTEAALLLGIEYKDTYSKPEIEAIAKGLKNLGAKNVIVKGVSFSPDRLGFCAYDGNEFKYHFEKRNPSSFHGTGDIFASVVTGAVLQNKSIFEAAKLAAKFVVRSINTTVKDSSHWYGVKFEKNLRWLSNKF